MTRRGSAGRWTGALVAACAIALLVPRSSVAASETEFGTPAASSSFGAGVTFEQPARFGGVVRRAEILVTSPDSLGPQVTELDVGSRTSERLSYTLAAAEGSLLPNTRLTARWRITYADGTVDLGPSIEETYADDRFTWHTKTGPIVRVHWYEGGDAFGDRALRIGEQGIAKASELLGVTESEPVDFFVYADTQSFYDALGPGTRENVGGEAIPEIRTLFGLITPADIDADWVGIVIPHELTHLVFDTATRNPYHAPPRWLNEGLAVYLSQGYVESDRSAVEAAAGDGTLMPLSALTGQFPTKADRFYLAYAESVSSIDFLVRTYDRSALAKLIRSYQSGRSDDQAFSDALGVDTAGFARAWLADLGATEPKRYGPKPAPAGPLPSDWQGPPPSGGAGATTNPNGSSAPAVGTPATSARPASPAPAGGDSRQTVTLVLAVVAVVLGLAGVALIIVARRRRGAVG